MARFAISTQITLSAATEKTAIRVNTPASRKAILRRVIVTDKLAGSTDEGVQVRIVTAGTDGTGTAATPVPLNNAQACVSTAKVNYSAEPTSPVEAWRNAVPAGAGIEWAFEGEDGIQVAHSSAVAVALKSTQARATAVEVTCVFEE